MRKRIVWLKELLLFGGLLCGVFLLAYPAPSDLTPEGMRCLGIAIICITLWVLTPIPLAATSLLAMVLLPSFGILDAAHTFSYFGNSAVFFLLGVFILAGAMVHTGLSRRLALFFLIRFNKSSKSVILGILFSCSFLSLFMPAHAVAAMMFPVVLEIAQALELKRHKSPLATAMFLALGWGAIIGSTGTFLGGARAPLAVGFLWETFSLKISFTFWALAAIPITVAITITAYLVLLSFYEPEIGDISPARQLLQQEMRRIRKISVSEIKIGVLLLVTILFWVIGGQRIDLAVISLAAGVMVFVLGIARWINVVDYVNWGVIIMYGGAIALGKALSETRAIDWIALELLGEHALSPLFLIVLLSALTKVLTELVSNAAAIVILVPFSFGFVSTLGLAPEILVLAITIPAGLAFCLPVGTPPNAIAFSSGYYSIRSILTPALVLNVLSWLIFLLFVHFYWPVILPYLH